MNGASHNYRPGFFERADPSDDALFYSWPRLVTHIDDQAIAAVGVLYEELGLQGRVLDLMSSWISHFLSAPEFLVTLGMNDTELAANLQARAAVISDLNVDASLCFADASFDAATCCVSVDYLTDPIDVFVDVARVLRPDAPFVCTFSNRCFPTKAIAGWLQASDEQRCEIVASYFEAAGGFGDVTISRRTPERHYGDPLFAVYARRR